MSNRYSHTQTAVLLIVIAIGSSAMARQARQPAPPAPAQAPAPAAQGNAGLNIAQMPTPEIGKPYRFSLCSGVLLALTAVSRPCGRVTFRLENGSWLPPGLTLDGFGVISGTTNVDVSKLTVKICAIQLGSYGTNFNCQGQPVGFAGGKAAVLNPPPPAPVTPAVPPGGGGGGAGGVKAILGVTAAVAGGVYGYTALQSASECTEPSSANINSCLSSRSCSACAAALAEYPPYCDCVEKKHPEAAGISSACRQAAAAAAEAARFCLAPNATLVPTPRPAVRR